MSRFSIIFIGLVLIIFVGCVNLGRITPAIDKTEKADGSMGYFFGTLTSYSFWGRQGGFGLVFTNREKPSNSIVMRYSLVKRDYSLEQKAGQLRKLGPETLVIVPVVPGTYQLTDIAFLPDQFAVLSSKPIGDSQQFSKEIIIQPGSMYYVGDWYGIHMEDAMRTEWRIIGIYDRFNETRDFVDSGYPAFKNWNFVNLFETASNK